MASCALAAATASLCLLQACIGRADAALSLAHASLSGLIAVASGLQLIFSDHLIIIEVLAVVVGQLGRGSLRLCRVERGVGRLDACLSRTYAGLGLVDLCLSSTDGCLIGGVVELEEHLARAYRLALMNIELGDETRDFRTYFHVLYAFDSGRVSGLQLGVGRTNCHYRILVARGQSFLAASATRKYCHSDGSKQQKLVFLHTYK